MVPIRVTSIIQAREFALRDELLTMRSVINQLTIDKQRRPQSLDDLTTAGYLKKIPTDPMTGRNDTWIVEWSNDRQMPGIINIRSGSDKIASNGKAYNTW